MYHPGRYAGEQPGRTVRLGDRRRCANEDGIGAVVSANPPQSAEHGGDLGAKNSPVTVAFIDDDVAESTPERRPPSMTRQQPVVHHVGIGQDDVRVPAGPGPVRRRTVSVIDRRTDARDRPRSNPGQLVRCECLGWTEIQHGRRPPLAAALRLRCSDRRQAGKKAGERLARRRPGRHDHVLSAVGKVRCLDLMTPRLVNSGGLQGIDHGRRHPRWPRFGALCPRRKSRDSGDVDRASGEERRDIGMVALTCRENGAGFAGLGLLRAAYHRGRHLHADPVSQPGPWVTGIDAAVPPAPGIDPAVPPAWVIEYLLTG